MKNQKKKGFTIVELVIVIAVIAILAAVLIPTFSNVIAKANKSAVQQAAVNVYKEAYALDLSDGKLDAKDGQTSLVAAPVDGVASNKLTADAKATYVVAADGKTVTFTYEDKGYTAKLENGVWTVTE